MADEMRKNRVESIRCFLIIGIKFWEEAAAWKG